MQLKKEFLKKIIEWQNSDNIDEWYFSDLRGDVTCNLSPEQAFNLVPEAVELILSQNDTYICGECLQLLLDIVRVTDTTEVHPILFEKWDELIRHVSPLGEYYLNKVDELRNWYRKY